MAKIQSENICNFCKYEFKWEALIPQHVSKPGLFDVDTIDDNRQQGRITNKNFHNGYNVQVECPKCERMNSLTFVDR